MTRDGTDTTRHHRTGLVSLLTSPPPDEQTFLADILDLDTKNYHVWSYRQWLVTRFPQYLNQSGPGPSEVDLMDMMIDDDVFNNSAWNHRYFVLFGHAEIAAIGSGNRRDRSTWNGTTALTVDEALIDAEIAYAQDKIELAPQNGSSWNYLKGVLQFAGRSVSGLEQFCLDLVGPGGNFYAEDDEGAGVQGVQSSMAIEMLIDIYDAQTRADASDGEGKEAAKAKVREAVKSLCEKWDPIRTKYWQWKLKRMEEAWQ